MPSYLLTLGIPCLSYVPISNVAMGNILQRPIPDENYPYRSLRLNSHPNIGICYGSVIEDNQTLGLSLRRYRHILRDTIREEKLSCDQRRACMQDVKRDIAHFHRFNLVNGDLNPSNIMLDEGSAVLIDFNSCRLAGKPMGRKGGTWGLGPDVFPDIAELEHDLSTLKKIWGGFIR